jgi:hypothetical protein
MGCVIYEFITLKYAFDLNEEEKRSKYSKAEILRKKIKNPNEPLPTLNDDHILKPILEK